MMSTSCRVSWISDFYSSIGGLKLEIWLRLNLSALFVNLVVYINGIKIASNEIAVIFLICIAGSALAMSASQRSDRSLRLSWLYAGRLVASHGPGLSFIYRAFFIILHSVVLSRLKPDKVLAANRSGSLILSLITSLIENAIELRLISHHLSSLRVYRTGLLVIENPVTICHCVALLSLKCGMLFGHFLRIVEICVGDVTVLMVVSCTKIVLLSFTVVVKCAAAKIFDHFAGA